MLLVLRLFGYADNHCIALPSSECLLIPCSKSTYSRHPSCLGRSQPHLFLSMQISKEGVLAAGKREVCHRCRHTNVHADISGIGFILETPSSPPVLCVYGSLVAESTLGDELKGLIQAVHLDYRGHGAEDFFLSYGHLRFDLIKDGGADKVAVVASGSCYLRVSSVQHKFGSLCFTLLNHAKNTVSCTR